ncbi:DUF2065 family protein [bacterium]|nr:DUF2065 family protein [bacterium]
MFYFITHRLNSIYIAITILIFLQGLSALIFPGRVKKAFERRLTLVNLRIYGGLIVLLGILLLWFYLSTLRPLFIAVRQP